MRATGFTLAAVVAAVALTAWRCGSEEKKKKDPAAPAPGPAPTTVDVQVPTDWDGVADWTGNALEVVEE